MAIGDGGLSGYAQGGQESGVENTLQGSTGVLNVGARSTTTTLKEASQIVLGVRIAGKTPRSTGATTIRFDFSIPTCSFGGWAVIVSLSSSH